MSKTKTIHVGLTALVPNIPGGHLLAGFMISAALALLFAASGLFAATELEGSLAAALFFCVINGYIVPVFHYICERTVFAIDALGPSLDVGGHEPGALQARVYRKPIRWFVSVIIIGSSAGVVHMMLLADGNAATTDHNAAWIALQFGICLTWMVLTLVIGALLDNAVLLGRLAATVTLNPFDPARFRPFGAIAIVSTLALIGAQTAFPILIFGPESTPRAFLPGIIATLVPMIALAAVPIWPIHRRLRAAKRNLLDDISAKIRSLGLPTTASPQRVSTMVPLLAYRREIERLPEWPLDVEIIRRLLLYLIIPPATWVAAALIQHGVESLL